MEKVNTKALLAGIDLTDLVAAALGQPVKTSGKYCYFRCPFHDDHDPSFAVTVDRYYCFGCHASGDAITWLMKYKKLPFLEACDILGAGRLPKADLFHEEKLQAKLEAKKPLPDDLQSAWKEVVDVCQAQLWATTGQAALKYLHGRGLADRILKSPSVRVGFSTGQKIGGVWVDKGVVLPCFTTRSDGTIEYIDYVKIRRGQAWLYHPEDKSKYRKLPGGTGGLYGSAFVQGADLVVVTEGEFDALLLHQEAGDLVGVCTVGSAADRFDWSRFGKYFAFARWILVAYDTDQAGQKGADVWSQLSGRCVRLTVPGDQKDITDAFKKGIDLSAWILQEIRSRVLDEAVLDDVDTESQTQKGQ